MQNKECNGRKVNVLPWEQSESELLKQPQKKFARVDQELWGVRRRNIGSGMSGIIQSITSHQALGFIKIPTINEKLKISRIDNEIKQESLYVSELMCQHQPHSGGSPCPHRVCVKWIIVASLGHSPLYRSTRRSSEVWLQVLLLSITKSWCWKTSSQIHLIIIKIDLGKLHWTALW